MSCWKRCVVCFLLGWKTALHGPTSQRDIPGRSFRLGFLICLSLIYASPKPPNAVGQTLIPLLCKCWAWNSRPSLPQKGLSKALGHWWTFFTYFEVFRKGMFSLTSLPVYLLRTTRRKPPNFRKIEKKLLIWKEVPELPFQFQFCNGFQFKNPLPNPQGDCAGLAVQPLGRHRPASGLSVQQRFRRYAVRLFQVQIPAKIFQRVFFVLWGDTQSLFLVSDL